MISGQWAVGSGQEVIKSLRSAVTHCHLLQAPRNLMTVKHDDGEAK